MHRVGILPFKSTRKGVSLLCVTSLSRGRWVLPKGRVKVGETHEEACHREGIEEAGVQGVLLGDFPLTVVIEKTAADELQDVPVTYYPYLVGALADNWEESAKRDRRWIRLDEVDKFFKDADYRTLIEQFSKLLPWVLEAAGGSNSDK